MTKKKLVIVDASSLIYRAFYAFPPIKSREGDLSNAVYGFIMLFLKTIKDHNPDFITVVYDVKGPSFRHKEFADYKANRAKTPDELIKQIPKIKEFVDNLNIKSFEKQDFEADDIIGTIVSLSSSDIEIIIISNDKDSLQLVDQRTTVYTPNSGSKVAIYNREKVIEKYQGITPDQFADFRALTGDPSDNIPGVAGIGDKTAIKLINQFKNIENLYNAIETSSICNLQANKKKGLTKSILEKLIKDKKNAFFSKKLSQIRRDVEIDFDLKETSFEKYDFQKAKTFIKKLGFKMLITRLPDYHKDQTEIPKQKPLF